MSDQDSVQATFSDLMHDYNRIKHFHEPCNGCVHKDKEYEKLAEEYAYIEAELEALRRKHSMLAYVANVFLRNEWGEKARNEGVIGAEFEGYVDRRMEEFKIAFERQGMQGE